MDRGTPIWKMEFKTLYPQDIGSGEYSHIWLVEMDCASGKINDIQEYIVGGEISPFIQWAPVQSSKIPRPCRKTDKPKTERRDDRHAGSSLL